jgi:hypothetical protein
MGLVRFNFVLRMRCIPEFICNVSGMFGILYEMGWRCTDETRSATSTYIRLPHINRSKRNEFCRVRPENPGLSKRNVKSVRAAPPNNRNVSMTERYKPHVKKQRCNKFHIGSFEMLISH